MEAKVILLALASLSFLLYGVFKHSQSASTGIFAGARTHKTPTLNLRFNENHEFTILQFTDLHYGNDTDANAKTTLLQNFLINLVKPDMVVITGDAVSGNDWDGTSTGFYQSKWEEFTGPYRNHQIPYAYAFGNHDTDADFNAKQIGDLDRTHPYSLFNGTDSIDPIGYSNYVVNIKSSYPWLNEQDAALLWIFDTKKINCMDVENSWACITKNQIDWFKDRSDSLKNAVGNRVDGLAFFHIPIPEYMDLWNSAMTYGSKNASVSCPRANTGAFEAFMENSSIRATFCGHDHTNDFGGNYKGIELVYGRKTGFGAKGPLGPKGARVIKLKEKTDSALNTSTFTYEHMIVDEFGNFFENPKPKWQGDTNFQTQCDFYK